MKEKCICLLTLTLVLLFGFAPLEKAQAQNGPVSDLQIFYYGGRFWGGDLFAALLVGEIDIMGNTLTPPQFDYAIADPDILLAHVESLDVYAFSFNCNDTITDYPGVRNPLTSIEFRKAIHRLSNRDYYVSYINQGFATKLPVPIAAPSSSWWNQSVVDYVTGNAPGRYPYPYDSLTFDPAAAAALLDAGGFTDYDGDGTRNYPLDWPGRAGALRVRDEPNLDKMKLVIREDDIFRFAVGIDLAAEMEAAGIPVHEIVAPFAHAYERVMSRRDYHIYTSRWGVGRFPTYLYDWFDSRLWFPGGSNYHLPPYGPADIPQQPQIDTLVRRVRFSPKAFAEVMQATMNAQYLLTEVLTVMVPLWSSKAFYAYSANLLGITNMPGYGPLNQYTYLKAWKIDPVTLLPTGGPIRVGVTPPPLEVNQLYSQWEMEPVTLNPFIADFLSLPPYYTWTNQPWLAQDWSLGTWLDSGEEKSKVTYWFRDDPNDGLNDLDAEWIEPITGNVLDDFTPQWVQGYLGSDGMPRSGYEFNCWYYASEPRSWQYPDYEDIHHVRVYPAEKKAEVYFHIRSYWSWYWPMGRPLYAPAWKQTPLSTLETQVFVEGVNTTTPGNLALPYKTIGAPVEIVEIREDSTVLTKASGASDNDYEMVLGRIYVYKNIADGKVITVTYWARGDPAGYGLGRLRYPGTKVYKTWVGAGPFYVTEHVLGAGGWTTYKKNPNFFLETPPTGEIDFRWYWVGTTQPRSGYYMVDMLDEVMSTRAYDSQGYAVPDPNWDPGADLNPQMKLGLINLFDLTEVFVDEGKAFGTPP